MIFLRPAELHRIRADYLDLLNGLDSVLATVTWQVGVGQPNPVYPTRYEQYLDYSVEERVHVTRIFRDTELRREHFGTVQRGDSGPQRSFGGDGVFMFRKELDLAGKLNVQFRMPNLGVWKLVVDPPPVFRKYAMMNVSAEQFVQYAFVTKVEV